MSQEEKTAQPPAKASSLQSGHHDPDALLTGVNTTSSFVMLMEKNSTYGQIWDERMDQINPDSENNC